ncbi:MAG: septal ring lytic transglycosylase RlpA family protein [Nitrospirota bacterium]
MKGDCYLKDPETGKFMGSKPGCSHGGAEVSDELSQRAEREKGVIKQRVGAAAALGNLKPKDSELKDKAERLAREVNKGDLSFQEGLYQLSKGNAPFNRYAKAVDLLDRDPKYWRDIAKKGGSDEVDTLLTSFVGVPVTGVADYALNASNTKSGVQQISDQKSYRAAPNLDKETVAKEEQKRAENIDKRAADEDERKKFSYMKDPKKRTQCSGNECTTRASMYGDKLHTGITNPGTPERTKSGEYFNKYKYTAAMQPLHVDTIPYNQPAEKYVYAEVTNTGTKPPLTVIVKVNDRGPYTPVKVTDNGKDHYVNMEDPTKAIDLSPAAYAKIAGDNMNKGVFDVKLKFLDAEEGLRRYNEQNAQEANRRPAIDKKVHEAQCANDPGFRKKAINNCPNRKK